MENTTIEETVSETIIEKVLTATEETLLTEIIETNIVINDSIMLKKYILY